VKRTSDRRKEERAPASGTVTLILFDQGRRELGALLLDQSRGGFRASHQCPELSAGAEVDFSCQYSAGRARVVWTRILGEQAESGFLILG